MADVFDRDPCLRQFMYTPWDMMSLSQVKREATIIVNNWLFQQKAAEMLQMIEQATTSGTIVTRLYMALLSGAKAAQHVGKRRSRQIMSSLINNHRGILK